MAYVPELGVGVAVMINSSNGGAVQTISRLVRDFLTRDVPRPTPPPAAPMPNEARTRYAGWYRPDNPRAQHIYFIERIAGLTRVTASDSALMHPLGSAARRYLPVSGLTFRGEREPVATLALLDNAADDRPVAIEQMGYLLPTSLVHVSSLTAVTELGLTAGWVAGLVLSLIALVIGIGRLVLRRVRTPSPARTLWQIAIATAVAFVVGVVAFLVGFGRGVQALGQFGMLSAGAYVLMLAFAGLAIAGLVFALRPARGETRRWSLWTARGIAVLNFVAAAYLIYWGAVGWRLWA
jgi:hypothetical protein